MCVCLLVLKAVFNYRFGAAQQQVVTLCFDLLDLYAKIFQELVHPEVHSEVYYRGNHKHTHTHTDGGPHT